MHFVKAKGILSPKNGMNVYRGCLHGCIYCDARSHCYQINHEFTDIEVKINAPELLEAALRKKRKKCVIATGAMSDPYIPIEKDLQITRQCLEIIDKYGFGATVQTKSDLILRDMDLFRSINEKAVFTAQTTMTTFDEKICKIVEPNVCSTFDRYRFLKKFQQNGIPTVVWLSPILPFINDTQENIKGILDYCIDAGVKGIISFGMGLTLRQGDREYYYTNLDKYFPTLKEKYQKTYGFAYEIPSPNSAKLESYFHETCEKFGILHTPKNCFSFLSTFIDKMPSKNQLSFLDDI